MIHSRSTIGSNPVLRDMSIENDPVLKPKKEGGLMPEVMSDTTWLGINKSVFLALTPKQRQFLVAFPGAITLKAAAKAVNIDIQTHYKWKHNSPAYAQCFESLNTYVVEAMEEEAKRRSLLGVEKNIYYQGEVVGTEVIFSDQLLMFMLRAAKPDTYRERTSMELTAPPPVANSELRGLGKDALVRIAGIIQEERQRTRVVENPEGQPGG